MSRWVSLNQARAKASPKYAGSSRNFCMTARYLGSTFIAMSAVVIIVGTLVPGVWALGARVSAGSPTGCHCLAPAGLRVSS